MLSYRKLCFAALIACSYLVSLAQTATTTLRRTQYRRSFGSNDFGRHGHARESQDGSSSGEDKLMEKANMSSRHWTLEPIASRRTRQAFLPRPSRRSCW